MQLDAYPDFKTDWNADRHRGPVEDQHVPRRLRGRDSDLVKIDRTDPRLIPDLTGSAEIVLSTENNTLIAPREAVFEEAGGPFVFLQGPEGWIRRKVDVGLRSFTGVAIHSGVQKGDLIATQRPI